MHLKLQCNTRFCCTFRIFLKCALWPMMTLQFVCLFVSRCSSSPWSTLLYQGWTLRYLKAGRGVPLCVPETDPFLCGSLGNLLFRGSRGLHTGRPIDYRPYSTRHVGLLVKSAFLATLCSCQPPMAGILRLPSTPRRHTMGVSAPPWPSAGGTYSNQHIPEN